jgi:hypothetical protein
VAFYMKQNALDAPVALASSGRAYSPVHRVAHSRFGGAFVVDMGAAQDRAHV